MKRFGCRDRDGRVIFVHEGLGGTSWGSFRRRASGSLQRVKSPKLPMRCTQDLAQRDLGRYADALPVLEKALNSIGQTVELLNLVGTSCLKIGRKEQGLPYLVRSLEMNPNQPEIRKAVDAAKAP